MQLDDKATQAFLKALQALSDEHGLQMNAAALTAAQQEGHPNDAAFYLETLFAQRTASHTEEQGEAPSGAYPRLLLSYAQASGGAFEPLDIEADSEDDWDSVILRFRHAGKKQRFRVNGVEDSDWFADDFVPALNRFAKRIGLPGRWVDFHNGDDACTSIYVPEAAQTRFRALRKKYSSVSEPAEAISPAEAEDFHRRHSLLLPPALEFQLDKAQAAQRKADWPAIEARLLAYHSKSDTKLFERYYLRGTEPNPNDFWFTDPIPLVYRLWLHPEQSDATWCTITERVLAYRAEGENELQRQRFVDSCLSQSRELLSQQPGDKPELFGEARERLTRFLQGLTSPGDQYRHLGERLYYYGAFTDTQYSAQCDWLKAETAPVKQGIHYDPALIEYWVDHLCGPTVERLMDQGEFNWPLKYFKIFLHQIAHYPAPVEGHPDYARQHYCQRCREELDARELPARLEKWWGKLKAMAQEKSGS